jgi:hypothetical protein
VGVSVAVPGVTVLEEAARAAAVVGLLAAWGWAAGATVEAALVAAALVAAALVAAAQAVEARASV